MVGAYPDEEINLGKATQIPKLFCDYSQKTPNWKIGKSNNREVEKNMAAASIVHAIIQARLVYFLMSKGDFHVLSELSIDIDGKEYQPDITVYKNPLEIDFKHDIVKMSEMPFTAIEIVSPRQGVQDVVEKLDTYLESGIQTCWLVQPYPVSVVVSTKNSEYRFIEGDIVDENLGVKISFSDLF